MLNFIFGVTGSGKTKECKWLVDNKKAEGKNVLFVTVGENDATIADILDMSYQDIEDAGFDGIYIDNAHLLTKHQVDVFGIISAFTDLDIYCYGERTALSGKVYEGALRLLETADNVRNLIIRCTCSREALIDVASGTSGKTKAICRFCYLSAKYGVRRNRL